MLRFDIGNNRFNFRSVAVVIHSDHILLHKAVADDFWTLPGGRVEFFETSENTVLRELEEELGVKSTVKRHLWYAENFFELSGKQFHEVANYFLVSLDEEPMINSELDFSSIEENVELIFRWVPKSKLSAYFLKPSFLITGLQDLPESTEYIKINELPT
ncbi:NUDIX hydrolase [Spartinivicinus poritis]|uniref:NUDIX hydrolase n=1 Tax=Spartinivicinus poritis TaxID=2994640 RepID=A0ABT5UEK2_9GAMM|nr:NUDIX hydrolase [Spartinivicinus sp. A2-2]MDE1463903.1 NUDIX hydrolase [Spartinivicinus sp. A2-2]